jgi:acetyl-CoA acetyltransferase
MATLMGSPCSCFTDVLARVVQVFRHDLAALVPKEAVSRAKIDPSFIEAVFLGCAMPEGSQGLNFARLSSL